MSLHTENFILYPPFITGHFYTCNSADVFCAKIFVRPLFAHLFWYPWSESLEMCVLIVLRL